MNNFPTMLAVSRQYMFELKWQNTFTNFSSAVELAWVSSKISSPLTP